MCGQYTLVAKVETIVKTFSLRCSEEDLAFKSFRIKPSEFGLVLTQEDPRTIQRMTFGYIPEWQKTRRLLINARSEGSKRNLSNDPNYKGGFHIRHSREFSSMFENKRCLVFANCFFEGDKKSGLKKSPYVCYNKRERIFAFGGLYKSWVDKKTGEEKDSFVIMTTYPNKLMSDVIGHHRMPVIIHRENYHRWLGSTHSADHSQMLHPLPANQMNAYRVAVDNSNTKRAIQPIGQRVYEEYDYNSNDRLSLQGMKKKNSPEKQNEYLSKTVEFMSKVGQPFMAGDLEIQLYLEDGKYSYKSRIHPDNDFEDKTEIGSLRDVYDTFEDDVSKDEIDEILKLST